ncbi:apolipoprotein N-acyltransferase, partial [Vibrio genomosp. F10 str. 9ZC157]
MTNHIIHRLQRPLGAVFVGALTTLAFAPYQIWPLAIISPLLLLALLQGQSSKQGFFIGYAWGIGLFSTGISWVHISIDVFGGMPKIASLFLMALLVGYLALYSGLFAWLLNRYFPLVSRHRFILAA